MRLYPVKRLYLVKAHDMYLGEVRREGLLGLFFPELTRQGWVGDITEATYFPHMDAWRYARKHAPCARVVEMEVKESPCV